MRSRGAVRCVLLWRAVLSACATAARLESYSTVQRCALCVFLCAAAGLRLQGFVIYGGGLADAL